MKTKKILTSLLTGILAAGTMTVAAMATDVLGEADFTANEGKTVYDGTNYYATMTEALKGVHGTDGAVLYCKPGADLGTMTHGHVCKDLTVYGNGAYLSGGEMDFEIDFPAASGSSCAGLTGDITLTVDSLAGASAWGSKTSEYAINLVFTNCEEMGKIFFTGTAGAINIDMEDCTFTAESSSCSIYSNTFGEITLDNVDFTGVAQPVALNNKSTGTQVIILTDCDFVDCGADTADYTVPVSVKSSVNGGTTELTVDNCTFTGTVTNSIGQDADILFDYGAGTTNAVIENTSAKVGVETANNEASYTEIAAEKVYVADNKTAEAKEPVAMIGDVYYTDLAAAFKSVSEPATIEILSDVTIDTAWQCNFGRGFSSGTFNNNEVTINGNDHVIKFNGKLSDNNTEAVISTAAPITVNNLTFDLSECPSYRRVISARTGAVINNCIFIGNPANTKTSYAVIVGETGTDLANTTLTVTGSDFNNFSYGVSDNRNGQDIKSVTVTDSEFTNAKVLLSASESITFNENVMDNGSVNITSYTEDTKLVVEMKENTLDATADNKIQKCAELDTDETEGIILPTITVGNVKYSTFAQALAAAAEDDTIYVAPGRYTEKLALTKNIVITGDPNYGTSGASLAAGIDKPVIVISEVADGGVKYQAEDVTFDNIVFEVAEDATRTGGYYACALGYFVEDNKTRNTLTVTNCDFINNSSVPGMIAIMAHIPNYTVTGSTFKNFSTGIYTALDNSEMGEVVVSDNTFANVPELYTGYWGKENAAASLVIDNNKASDDSITVINVFDYAKQTVGPDATAYGIFAVTDNDAKVILTNVTEDFAANATGNDEVVYTYSSETLMRALDEKLPEGTVYVAYGSENEEMFITVDGKVKTEVETVSLVFKANTDDEYKDELENAVWDIYLAASDAQIINRLNSADFTFELTTDEAKDAMAYEIIATNPEIVISNVNNEANRYEFHYDGKDNANTDTALEIKIGTVKFTGYGPFVFAVDTTDVAENTNQVHTTTFVDNLVDSFIVGGVADAAGNVTNELKVENAIDSEIIVPTKKLTIKVDFPNAINDNKIAYQQMKVTVSGGDLEKDLTIDLGTDYAISDYSAVTYDNRKDVEVKVSDLYNIEITNLLTINNTYNVTVEGEGYRTAKYTVTMTEDKTLNFWNNVKDNAVNVEEKKDSSAQTVTFLAGDIVKDSTINIYDLSAVVSYFGEVDLVDDNKTEYAKYDLNRDGKIDSKDVAYVLVSWGK